MAFYGATGLSPGSWGHLWTPALSIICVLAAVSSRGPTQIRLAQYYWGRHGALKQMDGAARRNYQFNTPPSPAAPPHRFLMDSHHIQWAKKLIDKGSNFACGSNYSPENKGKFMGNSGNKARYPVLCFAKWQTFTFLCWFDIDFRTTATWSISFFAHTNFACITWYHITKPQIVYHLVFYSV